MSDEQILEGFERVTDAILKLIEAVGRLTLLVDPPPSPDVTKITITVNPKRDEERPS